MAVRISSDARLCGLVWTVAAMAGCVAPPTRVDLPCVSTVGDRPPAETTVVVEVSRDGTLRIEGRVRTFDEYYELLRQRAAPLPATRLPGGSISDLNLLVDADRELPYAVIWRLLLGATIERGMLVGRSFFGVCSDRDGSAGALALFSPYPNDDSRWAPGAIPVWSVDLRRDERLADPASLYAPLVAARASVSPLVRESGFVRITPSDEVPWGVVLDTVDVAMRAGAETVVLETSSVEWSRWLGFASDPGPRDLAAVAAAIPADPRPVSIRFRGCELGAESPALPELPRRTGAYAGQAEFRGYEPLEIESEPEPEPDRDR